MEFMLNILARKLQKLKLMDRDTFLSPQDAAKIGLIDEVVEKRIDAK